MTHSKYMSLAHIGAKPPYNAGATRDNDICVLPVNPHSELIRNNSSNFDRLANDLCQLTLLSILAPNICMTLCMSSPPYDLVLVCVLTSPTHNSHSE